MANKIWIDVEDLFNYARLGIRPTGIQRFELELCRALQALPQSEGRLFFVRHDAQHCLITVHWKAIEAIFESFSNNQGAGVRVGFGASVRSVLRGMIHALPPRLRKIVSMQIEVFIHLAALSRDAAVRIAGLLSAPMKVASYKRTRCFAATTTPGDVLVVLGAGWSSPDLTSYVKRVTHEKGLRLAVLIHDLIPLRRPEWWNEKFVEIVRSWFDSTIPLADRIFTVSTATARDVIEYARDTGLVLRTVPTPIPVGSGFKKKGACKWPAEDAISTSRLLPRNSYALVVSTIEVRKNHALLFQVWRRLLQEMPATSVPTLIFAGRIGWQVSDLVEQLHNSRFLNGQIIHIESPTDEELELLYDGCLFTLFPSFFEGWGLPVTESLAFGRPCIISKATSLPEAGGSLARYIDPYNITDAYRVIRDTIQDRAGLREWRDRVRREFKPVGWSESARAVLKILDVTEDAPVMSEVAERHCA